MPPKIDSSSCNGCGRCVYLCPMDILRMNDENKIAEVKYPDECWHCGICMFKCEPKAITMRFPVVMVFGLTKRIKE